jgi:hypothetical protein
MQRSRFNIKFIFSPNPENGDFSHPVYKYYDTVDHPNANKRRSSNWHSSSSCSGSINSSRLSKRVQPKVLTLDPDDPDNIDENIKTIEDTQIHIMKEVRIPEPEKISMKSSKKLDVSALLQTIEEIENKMKMIYILKNEELVGETEGETSEDNHEIYEGFMMQQLAIMNFGRNYQALKKHQEGQVIS